MAQGKVEDLVKALGAWEDLRDRVVEAVVPVVAGRIAERLPDERIERMVVDAIAKRMLADRPDGELTLRHRIRKLAMEQAKADLRSTLNAELSGLQIDPDLVRHEVLREIRTHRQQQRIRDIVAETVGETLREAVTREVGSVIGPTMQIIRAGASKVVREALAGGFGRAAREDGDGTRG